MQPRIIGEGCPLLAEFKVPVLLSQYPSVALYVVPPVAPETGSGNKAPAGELAAPVYHTGAAPVGEPSEGNASVARSTGKVVLTKSPVRFIMSALLQAPAAPGVTPAG